MIATLSLIRRMIVILIMCFPIMMIRIGAMVGFSRLFRVRIRLYSERCVRFAMIDDIAPDAFAIATTAQIAMTRSSAAGTVLVFFLGLAMGAFFRFDQRLTVGDRDLVIVGMDFAEGKKAVAIAAIFHEGCLQRGFDPRDLGEIDVAPQLFALGGLEVKLFDAIAADHDNPGLFRVRGIDQHFVRHFVTLEGGGHV
jgi:hypothetical protein